MRGPLGPFTYLFRNAGRTLPLTGVILLAVMLINCIVALINSIPLSVETIYRYSASMTGITPRGDAGLTPKIKAVVEKESPVELDRVALCRASDTEVKSIVGPWQFAVLAVEPDDLNFILKRLGSDKLEGRQPISGKPEAVISDPVARNLKLKIGDTLLAPDKEDGYSPYPVKVVGIAKTNQWIILSDINYYRLNHFPPIDLMLAFAKNPKDQPALDEWIRSRFKGDRARVITFAEIQEQAQSMFVTLYRILDVVIGTLVIVITMMMGMLMNIHLSQRVHEFALLQAIGYSKNGMIRRVVLENLLVVLLGWTLGVGASVLMLEVVKIVLMEPNAYALATFDSTAIRYTAPVPFAIVGMSLYTLWSKFRKFDPVGVVERRLV